jgi:glucan phosphoethanolaminetransferase (alkaline phosphatase superfamily)
MDLSWDLVSALWAAVLHPGIWILLKLAAILVLVWFSNPGSQRSFNRMVADGEWIGIVQWLAEWLVALCAVAVVLFHPSPWVRGSWGALLALSTSCGWFYARVSGGHFSVHDFISSWTQRRSASSIFAFYPRWSAIAVALFIVTWLVFAAPPLGLFLQVQALFEHPAAIFLPVLSVLLIMGEFQLQRGTTISPMPTQFTLLAVFLLGIYRIFRHKPKPRRDVAWKPIPGFQKQSIVLLVDESIRGDYVSLKPGNKTTPTLPCLADKLVDFGPAVSGSNMSTYSNAILRFGARLDDLNDTASRNPTLFRYAKEAGFRTVYIDAQSDMLKSGKILVNFMTLDERLDVDAYYTTHDGVHSDFELADIVAKELSSGTPVLIYATKNGAHFPYEWSYPPEDEKSPAKERKSWGRFEARHIASYRKAVLWTVDKFMTYMFERADFSRATLIYTSDHGQLFREGEFPHGQVNNPDPRTGIVPLLVHSTDPSKRAAFEQAARRSQGRASHFLIAPTVYELMGYAREDIAQDYPHSLFTGTTEMPVMTSGDIFGVFSSHCERTEIDPTKDYFEHEAQPEVTQVGDQAQAQGSDQVLTLV